MVGRKTRRAHSVLSSRNQVAPVLSRGCWRHATPNGSKPARIAHWAKHNRWRAEFFALPRLFSPFTAHPPQAGISPTIPSGQNHALIYIRFLHSRFCLPGPCLYQTIGCTFSVELGSRPWPGSGCCFSSDPHSFCCIYRLSKGVRAPAGAKLWLAYETKFGNVRQ